MEFAVFISAISFSINEDSFGIFFVTMLIGSIVSVFVFFLMFFLEILMRGFTSLVYSSNVNVKLQVYSLSANKEKSESISVVESLAENNKINEKEIIKEIPKKIEFERKICSCGSRLKVGATYCDICGKDV